MLLLSRSLVVLTLLFAPWAFGSVEPWSQRTLQLLVFCACASAFIRVIRGRPTPYLDWRWVVPLALFAAYIAIQALNASHRYQPADQSLIPQPSIPWLPHSVDAVTTWEALGMLLTYAALFWVVRVCFCNLEDRHLRSKVRDSAGHASPITDHESDPCSIRVNPWLRTLLTILVISGFLMSMVAILHTLSGDTKLLWLRESVRSEGGTGAFVNRNNFAAYINLLVPVALSLAASSPRHSSRITPYFSPGKSPPAFLFYFLAAVMAASVFFCRSRSGMLVCVGTVAAWIVFYACQSARQVSRHKSADAARVLLPAGLTVIVAVGLVTYLGLDPVKKRLSTFLQPGKELAAPDSRLELYRATFSMFQANWLYGTGAGTLPTAFPFYQPDSLRGFYRFAHNDWLQWLSELGVVGSTLASCVLCSLCLFVAGSRRSPVGDLADPGAAASYFSLSTFRFPLLLSLIGVCLHAFVDFPFHIPGIATLAVAYLALLSPQMTEIHTDGARHT